MSAEGTTNIQPVEPKEASFDLTWVHPSLLNKIKSFKPIKLTVNDIDPRYNPGIALSSFFLSIILQRSHMKRYLMIKARSLAAFSFLVNFGCFYYVLFNIDHLYRS
jgi:hypothetical protein